MPIPSLLAWATVLVEIFGGLAFLLGVFVALASIPMAIVPLVAIFTVHLPNGFSSIKLQAFGRAMSAIFCTWLPSRRWCSGRGSALDRPADRAAVP